MCVVVVAQAAAWVLRALLAQWAIERWARGQGFASPGFAATAKAIAPELLARLPAALRPTVAAGAATLRIEPLSGPAATVTLRPDGSGWRAGVRARVAVAATPATLGVEAVADIRLDPGLRAIAATAKTASASVRGFEVRGLRGQGVLRLVNSKWDGARLDTRASLTASGRGGIGAASVGRARIALEAAVVLADGVVTARPARGGAIDLVDAAYGERLRLPGTATLAIGDDDGHATLDTRTGSLAADGIAAAAEGIALTVNARSPYAVTVEARIARLRHAATPPLLKPLTARLTARLDGRAARLGFAASTAAGATVSATARHDLDRDAGSMEIRLGPVRFAPGGLTPADLLIAAPKSLKATAGEVAGGGRIAWQGGKLTPDLRFTIRDGAFALGVARLSGLDGAIRIDSLSPLATPPGQRLRFLVTAGKFSPVPVEARFRLRPADRIRRRRCSRAGRWAHATSPSIPTAGPPPSRSQGRLHPDRGEGHRPRRAELRAQHRRPRRHRAPGGRGVGAHL